MQDQASSTERAVALSLIAFGVLFRLWLRYPTDFWEDEIIAATHAGVPLWQLVAEVVRNDTHPPLYFLQLDIWGWISRSDLWLTLNSVAWSYVAIFSLWSVAGRLYGRRVALLAAAVFAVSPSPTFLADQLRMYPMLATLFIWTFFLTVRLFRDRRRSAGAVAGLWLLQLAIINSHAIGFYAVLMEGIFALSLILAQPRERSALALWLGVYASLAVCALPWLVSGMMHDGNLGDGGGIGGVLNSLATTTIGLIARGPWLTALGILAYAAAVAAGLSSQKTRLATWSFLIAPLALSALVSLAYKPLFKWNLFSTLAAPVIALNLAIAYAEAGERRLRSLGVPAFVALLCLLAIATRLSVHISSGFRDRANLVLANYRPGDLVYAPQQPVFWGVAHYLAGPDWGSPLRISQPPSPQWRSVYRKLGPGLVRTFHLVPDTQMLESNGIKILVGNDSADQAAGARRIWLLTMPRADLKPGYPPALLAGLAPQWSDHNHTWATLYARGPQKIVVPPLLAPD